jgi:hypothetical protein
VELSRSCGTTTEVWLLPSSPRFISTRHRPVLWTNSAILFAHESEPIITGRAFPSSRQFLLQPPAVSNSTPGSYEPPTVLSVSPDENWLFAYFPGRQLPGVGCFWRAHRTDGWNIVESISFAPGRGVVCAMWLSHAREVWLHDSMHSKCYIHLRNSGSQTRVGIHRGFLHSAPQHCPPYLHLYLSRRTYKYSSAASDPLPKSPK